MIIIDKDNSKKLCPICGEGNLHHKIGKNYLEHKGRTIEVDFYYSLCDVCGSEQASPGQTRLNKRIMIYAKQDLTLTDNGEYL